MKEIKIESSDNGKIKYLRKVSTNHVFAKKEQLFVVETQKVIDEIINNPHVEIIYNVYYEQDKYLKQAQFNIMVTSKIIKLLSDLSLCSKQVCFVKIKKPNFNWNENILVLDHVQDPGNVGTLIRSAKAFNINNVLLINSCSIYNQKLIRSAKTNIFNLNLLVATPQSAIEQLITNNYEVIGTNLHGTTINHDFALKAKFALVLGNEGQGMSAEMIKICQRNVKIATSGVESLNVAIAGSILMHEFNKIKQ